MPLIETLTIEVGLSIAKSILKVWLKDSSMVLEASSSILDVLKTCAKDRISQQRAQRQFQEIGEKVGESLLPVFEAEGADLDEGSQTAIAVAVAATLNTASSKILAQHDLNPSKLTQYLLLHPVATEYFNGTELSLFERIIAEASQYIVDIASQLPRFTERTFAEILTRERQLLNTTQDTLNEVRRLREQLNPTAQASRFELEYRRAVIRELDVLELYGTDVSTASRRHRLSMAYITLAVEQRSSRSSESENNVALKNREDKTRENVLVSVDKALAGSLRLLIRGPAGSGKTTLLQWIAVRSASRTFEGQLSDWNNALPFYIRLRHCIKLGLPSPETFPKLVAPAIADSMPKEWVHAELRSGHALVLVDGLDEVQASQRQKVRKWLKELVETFPRARFIITSRPYVIEEGWMDREDFNEAELQPMGKPDIYAFIDHWHDAVREELQDEIEKTNLLSLTKHLKEVVNSNLSIRNLATNPLLCAMLCALNHDRKEQLPSDRIELYEACCYMLLERRDKERHIELNDYPHLTYRQKRVFLEDLAYWLIKNGWSEIDRQQVDDRFTKKLTTTRDITPDISGADVRRLFVERTGIIREPVAQRIDFTHRTFQEFLAAKAIVDEGDIGLLIQNAHNDQWREVIILTSGLAPKKIREGLLVGLMKYGDENQKYRYQYHLLAVSCLSTSVELGQDVSEKVESRLSKLVPPKYSQDAMAMASAGDLALPYLSKGMHYPDSTIAFCIPALAQIGSEAALDALEEYAQDASPAIATALLEVWDSFDRETYARRVLSKAMRNSYELALYRLPSLEGFQYLTHITSLNISSSTQISDISLLAGLKRLTSLSLHGCGGISDLRPLSTLTLLTSLDLRNCTKISDLGPLTTLTQLTSLSLRECGGISDLRPLSTLTLLTSLDLRDCIKISGLGPLTTLTQLTSLHLAFCEMTSDLTPLAALTQLTYLDLTRCYGITNLSPLKGLTQLDSLYLSYCKISDLSPLVSLTQLTTLAIDSCARITNLSPLEKLNKLKYIRSGGLSPNVIIPRNLKSSMSSY